VLIFMTISPSSFGFTLLTMLRRETRIFSQVNGGDGSLH
jgi:hypothetical protein